MRTVYVDRIIRERPSEQYLQHFVEADEPITYEDYMSLYWSDYKGLIKLCNGRLDSISAEYPKDDK